MGEVSEFHSLAYPREVIGYVSLQGKGRSQRLSGLNEALPFGHAEAMTSRGPLWPVLRWCFPIPAGVSVIVLVLWDQSAGNGVTPLEGGSSLKSQKGRSVGAGSKILLNE